MEEKTQNQEAPKVALTVRDVALEEYASIEKDYAEDEGVLIEMKALIREIKGDGISGKDFGLYSADELSKLQGTLASYKVTLGEIYAKAWRNTRIQEGVLKLQKAKFREFAKEHFNKEGIKFTVGDIDGEVDKKAFRARTRRAYLEEFENRALYLWRASNDLLKAIQGRMNVLLSGGSDTKYLDHQIDFSLNPDKES